MQQPKEILGQAFELTGPTMLAFPQVITPSAAPGIPGALPKFSAWLVFDPDSQDLKSLRGIAHEVGMIKLPKPVKFCLMPLTQAEEKDPEHKAKVNPGRMSPFYTGDRVIANAVAKGKSPEGIKFLAGKVAFVARSGADWPPKLAGFVNGRPKDVPDDNRLLAGNMFYTGALVGATVYLRVYEAFGGGVSARLNSLYSTGKGDRIGGTGGSAIASWAEVPVDREALSRKLSGDLPDDELPF